jgi:hypothetical protein
VPAGTGHPLACIMRRRWEILSVFGSIPSATISDRSVMFVEGGGEKGKLGVEGGKRLDAY